MSDIKQITQTELAEELTNLEKKLGESSDKESVLSEFLSEFSDIIAEDTESQQNIKLYLDNYDYPNISNLYDELLSNLYTTIDESIDEPIVIIDKLGRENSILVMLFNDSISQLYTHLSIIETKLENPKENVTDSIEYYDRVIRSYTELINALPQVKEHVTDFLKNNPILNKEPEMSESTENLNVNVKDSEEYKELEKKHQLLYAEFDNFRKRTSKEKEQLRKTANEKLVVDLLETLDNFDNASKTQGGLSEGIQLTYNILIKTLEKHGVQNLMVDGEKLDTDVMHPISQISVEDVDKKGVVVETFSKGYKMNDKVIRFPKVVIGI